MVGVFVWSGNFIDLNHLLQCILKSYVSPANIPGASWEKLYIGLKIKTYTELKAPRLDPTNVNAAYNSLQVCPHHPIAVYAHSPQSEHVCNMVICVINQVPNFLYRAGC